MSLFNLKHKRNVILCRLSVEDIGLAQDLSQILLGAEIPFEIKPVEVTVGIENESPACWITFRGRLLSRSTIERWIKDLLKTTFCEKTEEWFHGNELLGITGPGRPEQAQVSVVAVRQMRDKESVKSVLELLAQSGDDWKREFPGFISAVPILDEDSNTLINYPSWTDVDAYNAWISDPRMLAGQEHVSEFESKSPRYHLMNILIRENLT